MKIDELTSALAEIHNIIARVTVSGDNAIYVGNALQGMRALIQTISKDGIEPNAPNVGGDTT